MGRMNHPGFYKDEVVLCFHGDIMYEAKILELRLSDPEDRRSPYEYRVHYKGWKNTWDDWVFADRLRKATDDNRELAATLRREAEAAFRSRTKSSTKKRASDVGGSVRTSEDRQSSAPAKGTKRARDQEIEKEEQFEERLSVRIVLPDTLRSLLVDDWENITKNMQVVALPAVAPVNKLLQMYVDDEKPKRTNAAELDVLEEVVAGLKEYFEKGIGKILLYAHERDQYRFYREKLAKGEPGFENLTWSDLYGAEHMARLLSIMPELLAQTNMNQQAINRVREELSKFSLWMTRNAEKLFAPKHSAPANTFMWDIPGRKPQGTATSGLITVEKEQMARSLNPADEMMSEEMLSERPLGSDEEADEEDGDEEDEEGEDEEEGEEGDEEEGEEGEEEEEEEEEESS